MIGSVSGTATHQFITTGKSKFSGLDAKLAVTRLTQLAAASTLDDLGKLNSVGLHKLKGSLKNFWSIDVNRQWRIIFRFSDGNAYEVEITDTH